MAVFLGDYVSTHEGISEDAQLANLNAILDYKEQHPKQVVLLRGNHDMEAAGFKWAKCQPSFVSKELFPRDRFEELTQWAFVYGGYLFSHAGVSKTFLQNNHLTIEELVYLKALDDKRFAFTSDNPFDCVGESFSQPPTWIRPLWLLEDMPKGYTQVVGHTTQTEINSRESLDGDMLWLCDALGNGSYMCIEEDIVNVMKL